MYPSYETLIKGQDPERLLEVRRSFRSNLPALSLLVASTALVVAINLVAGGAASEGIGGWTLEFLNRIGMEPSSLRWLGIIPAVILLEIFRRSHDDLYVFSNDAATHYEGRLSLNSSVPSVKYADIKAITVEQSLLARIFDYGDILLDTPAQDTVEVTVAGVRAPLELALLIEELRDGAIDRRQAESEEHHSPHNVTRST